MVWAASARGAAETIRGFAIQIVDQRGLIFFINKLRFLAADRLPDDTATGLGSVVAVFAQQAGGIAVGNQQVLVVAVLADHSAAAVAHFNQVAMLVTVARQPAGFRQAACEFAYWPGEPFFTLLLGPGRILCGIVGKQYTNEPLTIVAAVYRRMRFERKAVAAAGAAGYQTAVESQPSWDGATSDIGTGAVPPRLTFVAGLNNGGLSLIVLGGVKVGSDRGRLNPHKSRHFECVRLIEAPASEFHQGQGHRPIYSPDLWLQSSPAYHHRSIAWHTRGDHL